MNNEVSNLALLGTFLGVLNYSENLKQTSNDDILKEIKENTITRLDKIIEQNNEILEVLKYGYRESGKDK